MYIRIFTKLNICTLEKIYITLYYMALSSKQYNTIFLIIVCFVLLVAIFNLIDYLVTNKYIIECMTNGSTSHTVNLPLTTTYSCKNFCGPTARCAITGQQCFTDIDCPGCQPPNPSSSTSNTHRVEDGVPANNDAGKLTLGVTPQYSPLTSGYGTHETIITNNMNSKPAMPSFGVNTWLTEFKEEEKLFNTRYKPYGLQYMPNYPQRYSLTGEFMDDGPLASNAPM